MASEQQRQMNELYASIKERLSNPEVDLLQRVKDAIRSSRIGAGTRINNSTAVTWTFG